MPRMLMLPESLSIIDASQRRALVQRAVIGLVALDFILWLSLARVVGVPFVIHVFHVHLDDSPADVPSLRVPGYVIAHLERSLHDGPPRIGRHQLSLELQASRHSLIAADRGTPSVRRRRCALRRARRRRR